jgi:hypothetical protein
MRQDAPTRRASGAVAAILFMDPLLVIPNARQWGQSSVDLV